MTHLFQRKSGTGTQCLAFALDEMTFAAVKLFCHTWCFVLIVIATFVWSSRLLNADRLLCHLMALHCNNIDF